MATNLIMKDGRYLSVVCSDPTTPASGDPIRFGNLTGIALVDESTDVAGETTVDLGQGVYAVSVKGVDGSGNSAVAFEDVIFYVDADTPKLSKKSTGYPFGVALEAVDSGATATIKVLHTPGLGSGSLGAGTTGTTQLADGAVTAAKLATNLGIGSIPLDIANALIISSNAVQNTTEGGRPDGNTDPSLARVNGATDPALRLIWAANSVVELQFATAHKPPDLDGAADLTVHLWIGKDTNTDTTAVVAVKIFDGIGDTNAGGNTSALATATPSEYTVAISAANLGEAPGFLNIALVPGAHTTDAIHLYGAWIEYARKG